MNGGTDPVRYGMIGGGEGAFIGGIHRTAAAIAGNWRLDAGAFSSDAERARRSGAAIGVAAGRTYGSWEEMLSREAALPAAERIEVVAIVTPNHLHAAPAIAAMQAGFDVIVDKPLADTMAAAHAIAAAAVGSGRRIAVTHTYTGYPLVKLARRMVAGGELGAVRRVTVKYTQDWLSRPADLAGNKQAQWRTDPARSGGAGAFGDIGTHAANLVEFITGRRIASIAAELTMLPGRRIDDDGAALFRLEGGARGTLVASQVCVGDANDLAISVYCDEAGLHWRQEEPGALVIKRRDRPDEIHRDGANRAYVPADLRGIQRTPGGHPEGYLEAFANIYHAFGRRIRGEASGGDEPGYATMADALSGMRFIRACLASSAAGAAWTDLGETP